MVNHSIPSTFMNKRSPMPVVIFTLAYLLIASVFALQNANWEFIFYIGVVVLFGLAAIAVHLRVGLSVGILWGLSIWGLLHMIGGLVPTPAGWLFNGDKAVFYSLWIIPDILKYDHVVHAYGFGLCTWLCWQILRYILPSARPTLGLLTLCALAGMGLGAFNEVVEFVAVLLIPETNVGGYLNTGWDLVSNLFGTVIAAVLIRVLNHD
jgi:hypothetical protein